MRSHALGLAVSLLCACAVTPRSPATTHADNRADGQRKLQELRARWDQEQTAERTRWTGELHAAARALADATYANGRAAIEAAARGTHRKPGNADRDKYRHPVETLELFGFTPTMTVLDVDPGEGWYTELLAPALASSGRLLTTLDTGGPHDEGRIFLGERFRDFLGNAPELYGKVTLITIDSSAPSLGLNGKVDMVLLVREVHGMVNRRTLVAWLAAIKKCLRPNGVLGIEDHRAKPDADPTEAAKAGYLPEKWTIDQIEAAGFELIARSEVNANPRDTKDYPKGVWTLPPVYELGDVDRAKYQAIGESDRFTLKFVMR